MGKESSTDKRLDNPARCGYAKHGNGRCRQTVSPNKLKDQEMTAYFVRVGRSFRVYGQCIRKVLWAGRPREDAPTREKYQIST